MPKSIITLRDPNNRNLPGEVIELEHVGAVMGGQQNGLLTIFNEDQDDVGPKPFRAIATDLVYSVYTPEFDRAPAPVEKAPHLIVPAHLANRKAN